MSSGERFVAGALGTLLASTGIYVAIFGEVPAVWRYLAATVLVSLGANAIYGALRNKRPWVSKIGPLP